MVVAVVKEEKWRNIWLWKSSYRSQLCFIQRGLPHSRGYLTSFGLLYGLHTVPAGDYPHDFIDGEVAAMTRTLARTVSDCSFVPFLLRLKLGTLTF